METTLLVLPVTDLAIIGGLAVLCSVMGWQIRRFATRGREASLQRSLFEAKGAIPQLESAVRNREQRVDTLALEIKSLKERLADQDAAARHKELEIGKRDREIRSLSSELKVLKDGAGSAGQVLLDGGALDVEPAGDDPELAKRYTALEARYDALARGLFQRDDRIAELEGQLKNPGSEVPTRTLEQELSELEQTSSALRATLEEREAQLDALQARLQEEVAQRETLEDLAKRRSEGKRELKAEVAKFEQQIPTLMETIELRDGQIAEREAKLVALNRALRDEQQQREAREAEIKDLQGQLAAMVARQRDLQQRLNEHDEAQRALQAELRQTGDTLRATESTVREREATIADTERRLADAIQRTEAGERTAVALESAIKDRDFKIAELETAATRQSAKLEMLRSTFFEAKASHNEHIAELTARHDEQRQAFDTLKAEHERLQAEAAAQQTRVAGLEQALAAREARVAEVETRLTDVDAQSQSLQTTISEQQLTLADRALELNELTSTAAELTEARETADTLACQVGALTEALARADSALRQRQCAIMWLVARFGTSPLLLPAPLASTAVEETGSGFEALAQAEVA